MKEVFSNINAYQGWESRSAEKEKVIKQIEKEIARIDSQIDIYDTNLKLIQAKDAITFKAYLGKINEEMADLKEKFKNMEGKKKNDADNLYGNMAMMEEDKDELQNLQSNTQIIYQQRNSYKKVMNIKIKLLKQFRILQGN